MSEIRAMGKRLSRYVDLSQYPLMILIKWINAWIVLALLFDIPEPGIMYDVAHHPQWVVGLLALVLFSTAGDAAKWNKRKYWENGD